MSSSPELRLRVSEASDLTPTVRRFVLRDAKGSALPAYEPGAHIVVTTPAGHKRSYSLVEPGGAQPQEYVVCVRRDNDGRGGSVSMHDDVVVGVDLLVSVPVNRFPLKPSPRYLFIAGGIGITPVRAMVRRLRVAGRTGVQLLYLTQSAEETPFLQEFDGPEDTVHHSDDRGLLDLWPYLAVPDDDVRVYCCGPAPLMRAVQRLTPHWRMSRIHMEEFTAGPAGMSLPFTAVWAATGRRVKVPAHLSLLAALRRDGIRVESSCEAGICGTCRLAVLGGEVEHRDSVLTEGERLSSVMACVSRARSAELVVGPHGNGGSV
ncbi:phthalate 4,5-dioxygenase reductase subunit [Kibdelosporangium banguiense]|uniref:Phthalate 4,5-dioxygenase reductase subunit n=1 Tax=Kibdelosporangium banguiense TaxID=1365924 RepID=A0ABS4TKB1_9PSEU|nr:PDR/VanB family oxidoreductase [Kibdelosporangium banguiense]MBP2324764.1 phthalate 4,5-dioxygenase reductase subunit [Kibdelosporangium banguiense]